MSDKVIKLPTMAELVEYDETKVKENNYMVLVNQPPPNAWVKPHPIIKVERTLEDGRRLSTPYLYIPIERMEYMANRIFGGYQSKVNDVKCIANSVVVTVTVTVTHPITSREISHDGVGACAIQTNKGAGAMDWNQAKSSGVQMAAPAAETYAIKNAFAKFGKLFGSDLNRIEEIDYTPLVKEFTNYEDLKELFELKKDALDEETLEFANRIITKEEKDQYRRLYEKLQSC